MNKRKIQEMIDGTGYWDVRIYNFTISYFGDEAVLSYYCDEKSYWEIKFKRCCEIHYETDVNRRKQKYVKDMEKAQLGYYGQNIEVIEEMEKGDYKVLIDLSIMEIIIVCKEIEVERLPIKESKFFWQH